MLKAPKKEKFFSRKLLGGLFSGLGFALSLVLISLGVYLVLAVAPGTTNPISPPPGDDVVWGTTKSCPVGQAIRSFNIADTNSPACEAVGASGCSSGILTAGANISLSTGASWDPCAGGATISYSGTGSLWTQSGSDIYYNAGNVGVGTTAPGSYGGQQSRMDVSGYAAANDVWLKDANKWASQSQGLRQSGCQWVDAADCCSDCWDGPAICPLGMYVAGIRSRTGSGACGRVSTVSAYCCPP